MDTDQRNELMHSIAASHQSGLEIFDKIDDIRSLHSVAELTTLVAHQPSDYSYFNFDKLRMHDLPRHLKVIANRLVEQMKDDKDGQGNQVVGNAVTAKNANVRKKDAPRIDLSIQTDRMKFFRVTKKAIYLCDRTIEKRSEKPCRMETERSCDYNGREFFMPYWKPIPVSPSVSVQPNWLLTQQFHDSMILLRPKYSAMSSRSRTCWAMTRSQTSRPLCQPSKLWTTTMATWAALMTTSRFRAQLKPTSLSSHKMAANSFRLKASQCIFSWAMATCQ